MHVQYFYVYALLLQGYYGTSMSGQLLMFVPCRVLAEFQTRKARRVHIRDKDMLKYWFVCLGITIVYLAGWTAANINYTSGQGLSLVQTEKSSQGGYQRVCIITGWNYVTCISKYQWLY